MDKIFLQEIVCPHCQSDLDRSTGKNWICQKCSFKAPVGNGIPIFSDIPKGIIPSEKIDRGPDIGTRWRQANWIFLNDQIKSLPPNALVLDVGAGRGDFKRAFEGHHYLGLEIFPYPEIDMVCDLNRCVPFKENTFDLVALLNMCEHVPDPRMILSNVQKILKIGGCAIVTIPFMIKMHQAPLDFGRYTHFALKKFGMDIGFKVEKIEGFYDPSGLIDEAERYYRFWGLLKLTRFRRIIVRFLLSKIRFHNKFIELIGGKGYIADPDANDFPAPTGYHIVYRKI